MTIELTNASVSEIASTCRTSAIPTWQSCKSITKSRSLIKKSPPLSRSAELPPPAIGKPTSNMHISEIDTPALVVDLDIFERNLARVADYARQHSLRLRPHTKTHKSVRVAGRQIAGGAAGLTVAKVSEAEVMVAAEPATCWSRSPSSATPNSHISPRWPAARHPGSAGQQFRRPPTLRRRARRTGRNRRAR